LSDGSGKIAILFSYVSIINAGLLVLAFYKDWKLVYRVAFCISWLIFIVTCVFSYNSESYFATKISFLTVHFIIFYLTFLAYKILKKEVYNVYEVGALLINSIAFFLVGVSVITDTYTNNNPLTILQLPMLLYIFVPAVLFISCV